MFVVANKILKKNFVFEKNHKEESRIKPLDWPISKIEVIHEEKENQIKELEMFNQSNQGKEDDIPSEHRGSIIIKNHIPK